jgi:predicted nucleotidyltransferase
MTSSNESVREDATILASGLSEFWQKRLGINFLGFYLLGSLAHDGFNRRYSDIDVALVAETGVTDADLQSMRNAALQISPDLAPKVSLFWTDRGFSIGRFPPLDRLDYLDHAVALVECERINPPRPSLDDIRTYLRGAPFENWVKATDHFAAIGTLKPAEHKPFLRAFLYAARFVYSWQTGKMASNDTAIAYLHEAPPKDLDINLLDRALSIRHEAADPDDLFPDRQSLPGLVDSCRQLTK